MGLRILGCTLFPSKSSANNKSRAAGPVGQASSVPRRDSQPSGSSGEDTSINKDHTVANSVEKLITPQVTPVPADGSQSLLGKVFVLTGGCSGIGLGTAKILSRRGATVCLADIDPEAIQIAGAYFAPLGVPYMITRVDISKRREVEDWVDAVVAKYGRLDGACNSAGIIGKGHGIATVAELDDAEWDRIIAVNLTGTMYCMRAQLRKIADGGSIVNLTSIHGLKGFPKHAAYDASKHGIVALTKAAALENGHREIRVNGVAPGSIYTPLMQKNWDARGRPKDAPFEDPTSFQRQGSVEECASVCAFLLGNESTFVSGSIYGVDGAWL